MLYILSSMQYIIIPSTFACMSRAFIVALFSKVTSVAVVVDSPNIIVYSFPNVSHNIIMLCP